MLRKLFWKWLKLHYLNADGVQNDGAKFLVHFPSDKECNFSLLSWPVCKLNEFSPCPIPAGERETYISQDGLRFLGGLSIAPVLSSVDLSFSRPDFDLRPLEQLTRLDILILDNCSLTDDHHLPAIESLRTLRCLNASVHNKKTCYTLHVKFTLVLYNIVNSGRGKRRVSFTENSLPGAGFEPTSFRQK